MTETSIDDDEAQRKSAATKKKISIENLYNQWRK